MQMGAFYFALLPTERTCIHAHGGWPSPVTGRQGREEVCLRWRNGGFGLVAHSRRARMGEVIVSPIAQGRSPGADRPLAVITRTPRVSPRPDQPGARDGRHPEPRGRPA